MSDKAIILKTPDEIAILREANLIVAEVLLLLRQHVEEGISTGELDRLAENFCRKKGGVPAFKGYRGFPGSLCVSLNEEVVHGIPSPKKYLASGDIISIDFGVRFRGYYGDAAITIPVGKASDEKLRLITVTEDSLHRGIEQARVGNRICDISAAIQDHVEKEGFSVVREYVGHGIGCQLHESPEIPNFVRGGFSSRLAEGMVLAIEPMVNAGRAAVKVLNDGWTVVTEDRKPSAHFEHSVAITKDGPLIMSTL